MTNNTTSGITGLLCFLIAICFVFGFKLVERIWPDHPVPVAIQADKESYVACKSFSIDKSWLQPAYTLTFKDNNGSSVTLQGIHSLVLTNLPQTVQSPLPEVTGPIPLSNITVNSLLRDVKFRNAGRNDQRAYLIQVDPTFKDASTNVQDAFLNFIRLPNVSDYASTMPVPLHDVVPISSDRELHFWKAGDRIGNFIVSKGGATISRGGRWVAAPVNNPVCQPSKE